MGTTLNQRVLLIVEDCELAKVLAAYLKQQGFDSVLASNGQEGLHLFHREAPDLILLDSTLPDEDGLTLCRHLRRESSLPILMLSESGEEQDCVEGLESGADDYMVKPLRLRELTARIHAARRRVGEARAASLTSDIASPEAQENILALGDMRLLLTSCRVEVEGRTEMLTPNEFRLLAVLMGAPGVVFVREDLRDRVWPKAERDQKKRDLSLHLVEVHIANLRKKIEADQHHPKRLVTVRSRGYKLVVPEV